MNQQCDLVDSKIDWIGNVPKKWEKTILGKHIDISSGFAFSSEDFDLEEGIPVIRIRDLVKGKTGSFVLKEPDFPTYVENDSILVGMDGDFNAIWWRGGRALLNQRIALVNVKNNIDKKFLYYFLQEPLRNIHGNTLFTTIKHLSNSNLEQMRCYIPKKETQINIRKYLDDKIGKIDVEINKNLKLVKLIIEKENALVNHVILKGMESDNKMEFSGFEWIGNVPKHWTNLKFFNILNEKEIRNNDNVDRKMLSVSQYFGIVEKEYESNELIKNNEDLSKYKVVKENDLVVNVMWLQFRGIAVSFLNGIVSPDYKVYEINLKKIDPHFLNYLVRSDVYLNEYPRHLRGIRPNSSRIINYDLMRLPLRLPSILEDQQNIVKYLDEEIEKMKKVVDKTNLQIKNLKQARLSLIYSVTTGKVNPITK